MAGTEKIMWLSAVLLRYQHTAIHPHLAGELVFTRLRRALTANGFQGTAQHLAPIRRLVGINLTLGLGLVTAAAATGGAY